MVIINLNTINAGFKSHPLLTTLPGMVEENSLGNVKIESNRLR